MTDHPKLTEREVQEGWVEWSGGECPVDPGTFVIVQLCHEKRSAAENYSGRPAQYFDWERQRPGKKANIIAYRVVSK